MSATFDSNLEFFIKASAVSGIAFLWSNFTIQALKMAWHIISYETWKPVVKERVMCEKCHKHFFDDLKHGKLLCKACRDEKPN